MRPLGRFFLVLIISSAAVAKLPAQSHTRVEPVNFDTTCSACTDFYHYANGGWIARTPIPATEPMWSSFSEMTARVDSVLRVIFTEASRDRSAPKGSPIQLIGAYYRSCMDTARANAADLAPLKPLLVPIDSIRAVGDVGRVISRLQGEGVSVVFRFESTHDDKDATRMVAAVSQTGLGLPSRDYYFRADARTLGVRQAYEQFLTELFVHAGDTRAEANDEAARDMRLEERLAAVSLSPAQFRQANTYRRMTRGELEALMPHFDWNHQLRITGAPRFDIVSVGAPTFFRGLDSLLANAPAADWRAYLRAAVLTAAAPALDSGFVNTNFRYRRQLTGASTPLSREQTCVSSIKTRLGELAGHEYVKRAFSPAARQRVIDLVTNLKAVLHDRIASLDWMSESTRREALAKLAAMRVKVGYPDEWQDYSSLTLRDDAFVTNFLAARRWAMRQDLSRIGKPVDRERWTVGPAQVDAFALSSDIIFPAGLLQPPFFDPAADDAVNYGAIGSMIGHEMTHHFDDQGRLYDAAGNLRDWWTPRDAAEYQARAARVVEQFNAYTVVDSAMHVNGRLTLGENIADLGGLKISYLALERLLASKGRPPAIDGFTPEQRFFLGFAQMWRAVVRPEYARTSVNTDPHAPWMWRVNGPLSNMPEFARAWGCKPGDPMVRAADKRAEIW